MSTSRAASSGRVRRRRSPRRRRALQIGGPVLLLLVVCAAWVGTRGYFAKTELEAATPLVSQIQQQLTRDDGPAAKVTADLLVGHSESAASLTSDPVWKGVELLPWLGPNMKAFSEVSAVVNDVAVNVVQPLTRVANGISPADFKPVGGGIKLQPFLDAQPAIESSSEAMDLAKARAKAIDTSQTLSLVSDATSKFEGMLEKASVELASLNRAVKLLPTMLGASGPRNYLVMFQNPAELRASGGIPGALAIIHTDKGRIALGAQASSASFPEFESPVLPLSDETRGLYGDITGTFMQDVTLTPDFDVSARLIQEMWRLKFGDETDGVISIDPITLGYLLKATGPVSLPSGDVITSDNAVKLLLTDVYERYPVSSDQDAFFAATAASVFHAVADGQGDPVELLKALIRGGDQRRVLIWNSNSSEQAILSDTTLAGGLPASSDALMNFGVYLNDGTGAKMGSYLSTHVALGQITCRQDRRPEYQVELSLMNSAPSNAGVAFSRYVTGGGAFGVSPGHIKTVVSAFGPPSVLSMGMTKDGSSAPFHPTTLDGYPVSAISVELSPGESTVLKFRWLGDKPFEGKLGVEITPQINTNATKQVELTCGAGIE
jgi:hypothetical protein